MKMVLEDELQALLLLSSLPNSLETLIISLSNCAPNGVVTMSQATNSLLNEKTRRKSMGSSFSEALVIERQRRNKSRKPEYLDKSKGRSKLRKRITCYHYGKPRHIKRNYWNLKSENDEKKKKTRKSLQLLLVMMLLSFHVVKGHVLISQVMQIG